MVYGFVKQSGGHVKIYSEVGEGTTIKLYLPRAMESEDFEVVADAGPICGGTETVLVVEDDDEVRTTVVELLTDLGYSVLKSVDAASALNVVESGVPIDILFTDVVMPGTLKSPELARKAKERLPNLVVLFTSGYTENSIVHGGKLDAGVDLLSKPYSREALARKFREVLANRQRGDSPAAKVARDARIEAERRLDASARRTVLLVEDDEMIRANTAEMLQGEWLRGGRRGERGGRDDCASDRADRRAGDRHQPPRRVGTGLRPHRARAATGCGDCVRERRYRVGRGRYGRDHAGEAVRARRADGGGAGIAGGDGAGGTARGGPGGLGGVKPVGVTYAPA
ncbi:response regulator [Sphingomonas sp. H160509]|uniref:response regulator n=1 Tax=Sphingomonas sp. H160509 TaxID=2955313 RepID=UPI00406BF6C9